jgi:membrane-associated phospholipid phosphatase
LAEWSRPIALVAERPTLDEVGDRRELRFAGLTVLGRRRRPSGAAEPLPHDLRASGRAWLFAALFVVAVWAALDISAETSVWWTARDLEVLRWFESIRSETATRIAEATHALGSVWTYRPLRWLIIVALVAVKHWRHLIGFVASVLIVQWTVTTIAVVLGRSRPVGIEIIGDWEGFAHPSLPVAALSVTLVGGAMALIPHGPWRTRALWVSSGLAAALGSARMYLGVDHPTDVLVGYLIGFAVPFIVFRLYAPESNFPVRYGGGNSAHLSIAGRREEAIRSAVRDQLGLDVLDLEPFALEGSAGSTPLLMTVAGDPATQLFGKLYTSSHLRSDRWYKVGRNILYGSLEDEVPFTSVRRLVEYEDYMLRYMRDEDLESAEPYGFVEITSEREYLIVTSFLDGAEEIGDAEITEDIADRALALVQRLWAGGIAHRDIKPSNVMVRAGEVYLIDVAFATIRPSPWRQAVDLANMILILSVRLEPRVVYRIAQRHFAAEDIAEAFAATRGITIPRQLRAELKAHEKATGIDLVALWNEITPERDPISIQRWTTGRVTSTLRVVLVGVLALVLIFDNLIGGGF